MIEYYRVLSQIYLYKIKSVNFVQYGPPYCRLPGPGWEFDLGQTGPARTDGRLDLSRFPVSTL
jgi:hypothetical protein